jgi:hypothetical protein
MKLVQFLALLSVLLLVVQATQQSAACPLCKTVMTTIRAQLSGRITEPSVTRFVRSTCDSLLIGTWCEQNLYPYFDEIFRSLRDNRTDSIACNRVNLCNTKISKVTGDIMFASGDKLSRIVPIGDNQIQRYDLFTISHPTMPVMSITGFACSPDYCAVVLKGNMNGKERYTTSALSIQKQIPQVLPDVGGPWFGPWYDAQTDEFWLAYGTPMNFTFGIFDCEDGNFYKRISTRLYIPQTTSPILSGSVLNRMLYFTVKDDFRVWVLDLSLKVFLGNITLETSSKNIMLVHNPVTQIMYGYTPGPEGLFRFDNPTHRTKIANIDFTGVSLVPSSTIDPTENVMWISLWGIPSRAWMKIDLKKSVDNVRWTPAGSVEGYFDFNPYAIERVDE